MRRSATRGSLFSWSASGSPSRFALRARPRGRRHGLGDRSRATPTNRPSTPAGRRAPASRTGEPSQRPNAAVASNAGRVLLRNGRRPSQLRLHPVHRRPRPTLDRPAGTRKPTNELEYVRVDLPVGLSVNPGATGRCPIAVFEAGACGCDGYGAKVGESGVTASALGIAAVPADPRRHRGPRLQPRPASRGRRRASASNCSATKSSSKATSTRPATTTRASRSKSRKRCRSNWPAQNALILKTASSSTAAPATAPSSPRRAPATAKPSPSRAANTRPSCAPPPTKRSKRGRASRDGAGAAARVADPAGHLAEKLQHDPLRAGLAVAPGTDETNSPAAAEVDGRRPAHPAADRPGRLDHQGSAGDAAGGDGDQPLGRRRAEQPEDLRKRPVRPPLDAQPITCPAESRIGTATIASAALPEGNLEGPVFIGKQESAPTRPPATSTGSSSTPPRLATGSTCGCSATSPPTRPPGS